MSDIIKHNNTFSVGFEIEGTSPLIQNNFSQKAIEQMLRKHMGLTVTKEAKKPREVVEAATIRNLAGRVCLPPTAIKKAMLSAATQTKSLKKTQLRTSLFVEGSSIPITYDAMTPRMDMVHTSGPARTPDVRFRPEFSGWKARFLIAFSDLLPSQTVTDLLYRAGSVGVGEWRPEKDGTFGTFKVTRTLDAKESNEVRAECAVRLVPLYVPDWAMDCEIDPALLQRISRGDQVKESEEAET